MITLALLLPCAACAGATHLLTAAIVAALLRRIPPDQVASAREEVELICEQQGACPPVPAPPCVIVEEHR
jgi:hypothetical protein